MPRIRRSFEERPRAKIGTLEQKLAEELKSDRASGQPMIDEEEYASGKLRVTVIWDDWDRLALEDRTSVILQAYDRAEGRDYRDRIALANGLTVPEAYTAGMLPFQIIPALRKTDSFTVEDCHEAMIAEGASVLSDPTRPQLRFATEAEAEACKKRLGESLPGSEPIWLITQELGRIEQWAQA